MAENVSAQVLPLAGDRERALRWLLFWMFVPSGVLLLILFASALIHGTPPWLAGSALLGPLLLLQVLYLFLSWRIRRAGVALNAQAIGIDSGLGSRLIALQRLAPRGLREIDLAAHPELRPLLRTWGIGLPGFSSGWYRLRDGRKALCLITDRSRVCMLEDETGVAYLLSLEDPAPLRRALERSQD
ncbi:MAG: hypothetical protein JSS21_08080 [Proteobacteria bacterium]|nr:hypothetical protein [Pseudomonadota bacterium]